MIAYMTHVFDELIGSPLANHYLAIVANRFILSYFICKTAAMQTAARSITSRNLYKILANGFLFVSFRLNNTPFAIGLFAN